MKQARVSINVDAHMKKEALKKECNAIDGLNQAYDALNKAVDEFNETEITLELQREEV